mmetsp:Transcript_1158/g.1874  ORF Transcript_1158/g.1874 Transcript_1158/m.1874 type:complete len:113 (-) Transcript_1158:130-468(-)
MRNKLMTPHKNFDLAQPLLSRGRARHPVKLTQPRNIFLLFLMSRRKQKAFVVNPILFHDGASAPQPLWGCCLRIRTALFIILTGENAAIGAMVEVNKAAISAMQWCVEITAA